MSNLILNDDEKREIKSLIEKIMDDLINTLSEEKKSLCKLEYITEDDCANTCVYMTELYKHCITFILYLYDNSFVIGTPRELFWNLGTCARDFIWENLETKLTTNVYKKIEIFLYDWNK